MTDTPSPAPEDNVQRANETAPEPAPAEAPSSRETLALQSLAVAIAPISEAVADRIRGREAQRGALIPGNVGCHTCEGALRSLRTLAASLEDHLEADGDHEPWVQGLQDALEGLHGALLELSKGLRHQRYAQRVSEAPRVETVAVVPADAAAVTPDQA